VRQVGKEPAEKRFDDVAGVLLGKKVCGHEKYEAGPEEGGPPGAEPRGNER
jgi:hypothetical protein